jgi:hypothetical protein
MENLNGGDRCALCLAAKGSGCGVMRQDGSGEESRAPAKIKGRLSSPQARKYVDSVMSKEVLC